MQNAFKRAFTMTVAVTTILWSVAASFAIAPVASAAVASGDLVKGSLPAVYYVGSDMKRYVFTNDKAYMTWYTDFSSVKKISDTDLAAITIGGNVTYKPGVKMIKIQSDPKVYAVAHGGVLRWVATEAAAVALFGANWNTKIDDISDAFFTNYTVGTQISSASDFVIANEQTNSPTINADKGLSGGGALNITLASDNPAGATVTANAQGINLLKFNIAGTGTITGLTFTRLGAGHPADWANVYLYDGDTRLTTGRSVSSTTNQVVFSTLSVAVAGTKELTLVGDLIVAGGHPGDVNYFALSAATDVVATATVGGTFPVAGNGFGISGTLGGAITAAVGSVPSFPSMGQTGAELASFKLTAGGVEDISIRRLVISNSGAGSLANVANLKITTGGTTVASTPIVSGSLATFVFAVPYVLAKGITRTFSVTGDMSTGIRAGVDTFRLYIDQTYDIYATGNTYGAGVNVTDNFANANATTLNVLGGQVTFASNGPTTGDVSVGANDAVIQKFAITSINHVEVRSLHMRIATTALVAAVVPPATISEVAAITDCKVKNSDTGVTITNSFDLANWNDVGSVGTTIWLKTFTDRFEIAAGQTLNLALTCDVASAAPAGLAGKALTGTVLARAQGDIRNLDSNMDILPADIVPSSALTGNPQTVRVSGLTVGIASSPSSATVTKGSTVSALGLNFTAGSASDVKVTQMKLRAFVNATAGLVFSNATADSNAVVHSAQDFVTSASIWDGTTQIGVAQSPDAAAGDINFSNLAWTIPAGTTKTVTVKVLLSNNLPYGVNPNQIMIDMIGDNSANHTTANVTAQDKDSNAVTATAAIWNAAGADNLQVTAAPSATVPTLVALNAGAIVVAGVRSGTLQAQIDGDTPTAAIVTANTSDNAVTRVKFTSINEAFSVTRMTVADTVAGTSRSITSVRLFDKNGTLFCSGALDSNSRLRCANDAGLFTVDGGHVVTIKVNIDQEGSGTTGANSGDAPKMALYVSNAAADAFTDDIKAIGVSSGTALQDTDVRVPNDTHVANNDLIAFTEAPFKIFATNAPADTVYFQGGGAALITGTEQVIRKSQPTVATIATTTTLTPNPTLYKFSVTASSNADVAIKRFTLDESSTANLALSDFRVYENDAQLDNALYEVIGAGTGAGQDTLTFTNGVPSAAFGNPTGGDNLYVGGTIPTTGANTTVTVLFLTERVVSAGSTKTFRIDASIAGVKAGESVTMKLKDDSALDIVTGQLNATAVAPLVGATADLETANFVWSDTSADAHSSDVAFGGGLALPSSADWTNGKYVKTLPTNPQTLSL